MIYDIKSTDYSVTEVTVPINRKNDKEALKIFAVGCSHIDSIYTAKNTLKRHLDKALEENALIVFLGDNNDLMQGKGDRRHMKQEMEKMYAGEGAYFNEVVDYTVDFMKPYANNLAVWAWGNHELSALRHNEVDVPRAIVDRLNNETGANVQSSGYRGWVQLRFKDKNGQFRITKNIFYSHSPPSGGKRSKGALSIDLLLAQYPDADVYLAGHLHENLLHFPAVEGISNQGKRYFKEKMYAQMPTYKEDWKDKTQANWWIETNKGNRVIGGWMLDFTFSRKRDNNGHIKNDIVPNARMLKN